MIQTDRSLQSVQSVQLSAHIDSENHQQTESAQVDSEDPVVCKLTTPC